MQAKPNKSPAFFASNPTEDPYLFLESLNTPQSGQWVAAQNARTMRELGEHPAIEPLAQRLTTIYNSRDRIVTCSRRGDWGYNIWTDADHALGLVRRTPWQAWLDGKPQWQTVLNVDELDMNRDTADATRWTLADFDMRYMAYDRALVSLSPDGSDACMIREFDIEAGGFVEGGFEILAVGQHSMGWIDRDTVYVGWDDSAVHEPPALTAAGYPRQIRRWRRGTALESAPVIFECAATNLSANVWYDLLQQRHLAMRYTSLWHMDWFWLDEPASQWRRYDVPQDAQIDEWNDWLFITLRSEWETNGTLHAAGSLLAVQRNAFLHGQRNFQVLYAPSARRMLAGFDLTRQWVIVTERQDCVPHVTLWRPPADDDGAWTSRQYELPPNCEATVSAVDAARDDTVLIHTCHFLVPPSLYHADLGDAAPWHLLARQPPQFDASGMTTQLRYATAPDGMAIPYWLIGKLAGPATRPQPCLLYGYGGFDAPQDQARYLDTVGITWLERGGTYAIACTRGGGEFGPTWHQAALHEKRQVAFDDFIAVAQALADTGVTNSRQLAIRGESNGGLLVATCMTQRPELFGAVLAAVPVLDMARFHNLLQGASWIDEYGNPDDPMALPYLLAYSPYHNVRPGVNYPPILFTTSSSDDRVHPAHARKMAAKMQDQGHDRAWCLERRDGGHGAGVDAQTIAQAEALEAQFLWQMVAE